MILKQRKYKEYNRNEISLRNDDVFKIAPRKKWKCAFIERLFTINSKNRNN